MPGKKSGSERGGWDSWFEFLFSCLGSMVGLGNIWRFPYVCYRSGGGAFLIPFFVSMIVCGCPLIFLETAYCQYSSLGPGKVWVVCPLFKGIGFGMMTVTFVVSIYYTVIMAWTLYYVVSSFRASLPWSVCQPGLRSLECLEMVNGNDSLMFDSNRNNASTPTLLTTAAPVVANLSTVSVVSTEASGVHNLSDFYETNEEAYWFQGVLNISTGLGELGEIQWPILVCLLVAWILVFLCLIRGIKSMGKVVYVAATVPYLILTCLLIRGCLLPGAGNGLYFYMVPVWDKLLSFQVWRNAASQVFFSIGMGFGLISTLASYNKFHNNCYRDAMILPVLDCGTSVFAGLIIFSFLGYMASITGKSVDQVAQEGPGLVFVAYPSVLSTLPLPQLWSVLFFSMLFFVGLDSQFMHVQGVATALTDCFPDQLRQRKTQVTLAVCVISFFLGIPITTQGGFYLLNLIDWYIASFSVMFIVFLEVMVLAWIYGRKIMVCRVNGVTLSSLRSWSKLGFMVGIKIMVCRVNGVTLSSLRSWSKLGFMGEWSNIVFLEVMVLAWIYGTDRLFEDISAMIGDRPHVIFKFAWKYFTPAFVIVLWLSGLFNFTSIGEENTGYPPWADTLGILIGFLPILPVPVKMAWTLLRDEGDFRKRLRRCVRPSPLWKPAVERGVKDDDYDLDGSGEGTSLNGGV
ncbi:hypothetical protein RRG08_017907 [Elysia crispata]|uniref:Transporter n=1 Tax=Elysia crispata TaxID=231223 RepID=A0AAE1DWQ0_9GAST|nr:hypothetical protein RRG08_017907 [Elysia crispata]